MLVPSLLILYKFHDPVVDEIIKDIIIPVCSRHFRTITIEFASDDPSHKLYWAKIYHITAFSVDAVIQIKRWGEGRSAAIAVEQNFAWKMLFKAHPFAKLAVRMGYSNEIEAAVMCAPYSLTVEVTEKLFRTGYSRLSLKEGVGLISFDKSAAKARQYEVFASGIEQVLELIEVKHREFRGQNPDLYAYWLGMSETIQNSEVMKSVSTWHGASHYARMMPDPPYELLFEGQMGLHDWLENEDSKNVYGFLSKFQELISLPLKSRFRLFIPANRRAFEENTDPKVPWKFVWIFYFFAHIIGLPFVLAISLMSVPFSLIRRL